MEIITAVNAIVAAGRANRGSVVVAYAQLMAQTIAQSGPDVAPEIRQGIMTLIDDYALRLAMEGHP